MAREQIDEKAMAAVQTAMPASWVAEPGYEEISPKAIALAKYFANVMEKTMGEAMGARTEAVTELANACRSVLAWSLHTSNCGVCAYPVKRDDAQHHPDCPVPGCQSALAKLAESQL